MYFFSSFRSPGSLPYGDSPPVAAAYTMATAALLSALAFVLVAGAVTVFESLLAAPQNRTTSFPFLFPLLGLVAAVLVTPAAFVVGVVTWKWVVPEGASARRGGFAGVLTVLGTYLVAGLSVSILGVVVIVLENIRLVLFFDQWTLTRLVEGTPDGAWAGGVAVAYGLMLTWWVTFPLGFAAGWRHQRRT